jgi:hypothetical protein
VKFQKGQLVRWAYGIDPGLTKGIIIEIDGTPLVTAIVRVLWFDEKQASMWVPVADLSPVEEK